MSPWREVQVKEFVSFVMSSGLIPVRRGDEENLIITYFGYLNGGELAKSVECESGFKYYLLN